MYYTAAVSKETRRATWLYDDVDLSLSLCLSLSLSLSSPSLSEALRSDSVSSPLSLETHEHTLEIREKCHLLKIPKLQPLHKKNLSSLPGEKKQTQNRPPPQPKLHTRIYIFPSYL